MEVREPSSSSGSEDQVGSHGRYWGDDIDVRWSNVFRIGFLNVGGLMVDGHGAKMDELRIYLTRLRLDAIGITECNVHWKIVPIQKCLPERMRGWWECLQINTAYFEAYQILARHQAGGVSLWSQTRALIG